MSDDREPDAPDLRSRLAHIPTMSESPLDSPWLHDDPDGGSRLLDYQDYDEAGTRLLDHDDREPYDGDPYHYETDQPFEEHERRRRRWPMFLGAFVAIVALVMAVPVIVTWRAFDSIERVPVGDVLSAPVGGRNVLLIGTDSRAGIDSSVENSGAILGGGLEGERSDTIMVVRIGDDGSRHLLSLPRDLWLPINGGGEQRINTAIAQGPVAVVNTIQSELGIPITNYMEVDLAGFIDLVDAVGGVTISIPYPAFDRASGLDLPVAGDVELDSAQALAFVRSRRYTEIIDGVERTDPTSDLGRVRRQQDFLRAMFDELIDERNPLTANEIIASSADAVRLDDATSFSDLASLAFDLRSGLPDTIELPTVGANIGGRSVLLLGGGADDVLRRFGA